MPNSMGGKITHIMVDGTVLDDISDYLSPHDVEIPPVVLRIVAGMLTEKKALT